jgi:hypothetical protein
MIDINELRRLAQDQEWIGRWYDAGCETLMAERNGEHEEVAHPIPIGLVPYLIAVQPASILELLDRLEAAESDGLEQARLLGMSGEREAALLSKLEAAVNHAVDEAYQRGYATGQEEVAAELEFAKQEIANLHDDISEWMDKCDELRAKIEAMEKQEPVGEIQRANSTGNYINSVVWVPLPVGSKLYAHPVAKPAPSVPDEVMRDALRYRFLRSARNIPISTKAARDPVVYDEAIDAAMLAAAPEVKP